MHGSPESTSKPKSNYGGMLGLSLAMTAAAHPITYVKVLIQVGHEPLPPRETTTFFGKEVLSLPNFLQYVGHIKENDGWLGLYRGLGPRIAHNIVSSAVTNTISNKIKEENAAAGILAADEKSVKGFIQETMNLSVAKTAGIVCSYPFQTIGVRMMVQFIGGETHYTNLYSSIKQIYQEEGIDGFFKGFVPYLIGELLGLWLFRSLNYVVLNYIMGEKKRTIMDKQYNGVRTYSQGISQYIVSMISYPFQLVSNIMAINGTKLSAGRPPLMPIYDSWTECWIDLGEKGLRQRGSTLFRRHLPVS